MSLSLSSDEIDNDFYQIVAQIQQSLPEPEEALTPLSSTIRAVEKRYTDLTFLGEGSLKKVYQCRDNYTQRDIAYATLHPSKQRSRFQELFMHEAWITSFLNHPNIIKVHDVGISAEHGHYFTMDLYNEDTLVEFARHTKDLSILIPKLVTICEAISYAHSKGVLHLDLKPHNIQCGSFSQLLVCDWGLGQSITRDHTYEIRPANALTLAHMKHYAGVVGTPGYMAPEQAQENRPKDERTDVYGLGAILYFLLTDRPPLGGSVDTILRYTIEGKITPPSTIAPQTPRSLNAICMCALATNPQERYQSVTEFATDLQRYLNGYPALAEQASPLRKGGLYLLRHKAPLSICTMLLGIALTSWSIVSHLRSKALHQESLANTYSQRIDTIQQTETRYNFHNRTAKDLIQAFFNGKISAEHLEHARPLLTKHSVSPKVALNNQAWLNYLNTIQMNFSAVIQTPAGIEKYPGRQAYQVAQLCPSYTFSKNKRPTQSELIAFLQKADLPEMPQKKLINRIIAYDLSLRPADEPYHAVIIQFLHLLNSDEAIIEYNHESRALKISDVEPIRLIINNAPNLLKALPLNTLELSRGEAFALGQCHEMNIQTLIIHDATKLAINNTIRLENLEEIVLCSNVNLSDETLLQLVRSTKPYRITRQ